MPFLFGRTVPEQCNLFRGQVDFSRSVYEKVMRKVVTSKFGLYLLGCASLYVPLILFFKLSFYNGPETELKLKTDIESLYNICMLSYTDRLCLVRFSSNISCDCKHNVHFCYDHRGNRFIYQLPNKQFFSSEQSTQQATCYTKHTITNRFPVTAKLQKGFRQ